MDQEIRTKLRNVLSRGIEPAVLKAMMLGLRRMKENVSSQRLIEAEELSQ